MENELYLEAVRQLRQEVGEENMLFCPPDLHPDPGRGGRGKIETDAAIGEAAERARHPSGRNHRRCSERLTEKIKQKIALFCNIDRRAVISGLDVQSVYQIPLNFEEEGLTEIVHKRLKSIRRRNSWSGAGLLTAFCRRQVR